MMRVTKATALLALGLSVAGCSMFGGGDNDKGARKMAVAEIHQAGDQSKPITGTVTFTETGDGPVRVVASVDGLTPGEHGFHIHEKGDLSKPDLTSTGGHFNPTHQPHGAPAAPEHHAGDFGNLTADVAGHARKSFTVHDITLGTGQPNDIVGRAVIIHGKSDDLTSQPAGNAGPRVAGGVITLENK